MANIDALQKLNLNTRALESVRDVRKFIEGYTTTVPLNSIHKITVEVPGQALAGHTEYRAMLQEYFDAMLPELNQKILTRLRQREADAKESIRQAAERL